MRIKTKYDIGQNVVLKHDREKQERQISGISIRGEKPLITYNLITGVVDSWHYEFEIDKPQNEHKAGFKIGQ